MVKATSKKPFVITAIVTPLEADESLCVEGLEAHLEDQWNAGINGLFVAGSMGEMQLLADRTYAQLVERAVHFSRGRGEVLVGVGDTSLVRTLDRVRLVNKYNVDGVVVITPYFGGYKPAELVDYYRALADASRHPVYLYDLPCVTGTKLDFETVERAAEHPNIHGIKASCEVEWTKELARRIGDRFRVIVAQPRILGALLHEGINEHLDGVYALAPQWTMAIVRAAQSGDWNAAEAYQKRLNTLLDAIIENEVLACVTTIFNARGIPGKIGALPLRQHDKAGRERLLSLPIVQELLDGAAAVRKAS